MVICQSCGAQNEPNAATCSRCFAPLTNAAPAPPSSGPAYSSVTPGALPPPPPPLPAGGSGGAQAVPNYLVQSILTTVLCCLPLGIVAIIFSAQVNTKLAAGDYAGALESSRKAKMFCWIALGLGIAATLIGLLLGVFGAMMGTAGR